MLQKQQIAWFSLQITRSRLKNHSNYGMKIANNDRSGNEQVKYDHITKKDDKNPYQGGGCYWKINQPLILLQLTDSYECLWSY